MNFEEIKSFIEENKESNEEVKTYLQGFVREVPSELKLDSVKSFLEENEEAKGFLNSVKDSHFSKSLETWKKNNLENILNDEIKKRFPDEDPASLKTKALEQKIQELEQKALRNELRVKAKDTAKEKNLPFGIVDYFLGSNEEETNKNLQNFEQVWIQAVQEAVEKTMKENGGTPPASGNGTNTFTIDDVLKMSEAEIKQNWEKIKHLM